jgi:hypothetical protein
MSLPVKYKIYNQPSFLSCSTPCIISGSQGSQGSIGPSGFQGAQGDTGPKGEKGLSGCLGAQGPQGIPGKIGSAGGDGGFPFYLNYTNNSELSKNQELIDPGPTYQTYYFENQKQIFLTSNLGLGYIPEGTFVLYLYCYAIAGPVNIQINLYSATIEGNKQSNPFALSGIYTIFEPQETNKPTIIPMTSTSVVFDELYKEILLEISFDIPSDDGLVIYYQTPGKYSFLQSVLTPVGNTGAQGAQGPIGYQGFDGIPGITGVQGSQGPQGYIGYIGPQGTTGAQGAQGAQGANGTQGLMGTQGIQGSTGSTGSTGTQGAKGDIGEGGIISHYANFYDTTVQSNNLINNVVLFNSTSETYGITVENKTKINFSSNGTYNISFSLLFQKTTLASKQVFIWLRLNGLNISWTNREISLLDSNFEQYSFSHLLTLTFGDYVELCWNSTDATVNLLSKTPISGSQVPSASVSISQVTYTELGPQGPQGPQGQLGSNVFFKPMENSSISSVSGPVTIDVFVDTLVNYVSVGAFLFVANSNPLFSGYLIVLDYNVMTSKVVLTVGWVQSNTNSSVRWDPITNIILVGPMGNSTLGFRSLFNSNGPISRDFTLNDNTKDGTIMADILLVGTGIAIRNFNLPPGNYSITIGESDTIVYLP